MDKEIKYKITLTSSLRSSGSKPVAIRLRENMSGDNETLGNDFPRWGDRCAILLDTFQKFPTASNYIPSGQQGCMWSGDFNVGRCTQFNSRRFVDPTCREGVPSGNELNLSGGNITLIFHIQFSNHSTVEPLLTHASRPITHNFGAYQIVILHQNLPLIIHNIRRPIVSDVHRGVWVKRASTVPLFSRYRSSCGLRSSPGAWPISVVRHKAA